MKLRENNYKNSLINCDIDDEDLFPPFQQFVNNSKLYYCYLRYVYNYNIDGGLLPDEETIILNANGKLHVPIDNDTIYVDTDGKMKAKGGSGQEYDSTDLNIDNVNYFISFHAPFALSCDQIVLTDDVTSLTKWINGVDQSINNIELELGEVRVTLDEQQSSIEGLEASKVDDVTVSTNTPDLLNFDVVRTGNKINLELNVGQVSYNDLSKLRVTEQVKSIIFDTPTPTIESDLAIEFTTELEPGNVWTPSLDFWADGDGIGFNSDPAQQLIDGDGNAKPDFSTDYYAWDSTNRKLTFTTYAEVTAIPTAIPDDLGEYILYSAPDGVQDVDIESTDNSITVANKQTVDGKITFDLESAGGAVKVREGDLHLEYSDISKTSGRLTQAGYPLGNSTFIFESVHPTSNLHETADELLASYIQAYGIDNGNVKFGMMDLRNFAGDPTDTSSYVFTLIDNFITTNPYYIIDTDAIKLNSTSPDIWNDAPILYFLTTCTTFEDLIFDNGAPLNINLDSGTYLFKFDLTEESLFSKILLNQMDNPWNLQNLYPYIGLQLEGFEASSESEYDKSLSRIAPEQFYLDEFIKVGVYCRNVILTQPIGGGMANFRIESDEGKYIDLTDGEFTYEVYDLFSGNSMTHHPGEDEPITTLEASPYMPFNLGLGKITSVTGTLPGHTVNVLDDVNSLKQKINSISSDTDAVKVIQLGENSENSIKPDQPSGLVMIPNAHNGIVPNIPLSELIGGSSMAGLSLNYDEILELVQSLATPTQHEVVIDFEGVGLYYRILENNIIFQIMDVYDALDVYNYRAGGWSTEDITTDWCTFNATTHELKFNDKVVFIYTDYGSLPSNDIDTFEAGFIFQGELEEDVQGIINPNSETIDVTHGVLEVKPLFVRSAQLGLPDGQIINPEQPGGILKIPNAHIGQGMDLSLSQFYSGLDAVGLKLDFNNIVDYINTISGDVMKSAYIFFQGYNRLTLQFGNTYSYVEISYADGDTNIYTDDKSGTPLWFDIDLDTDWCTYDATTHQVTFKTAIFDHTTFFGFTPDEIVNFNNAIIFLGIVEEDTHGLISPRSDTITVDNGILEAKISEDEGNALTKVHDGLYVATGGGGTGDVDKVQMGPDGEIIDPSNGIVTLPYSSKTALTNPDLTQIVPGDDVSNTYLDLLLIQELFIDWGSFEINANIEFSSTLGLLSMFRTGGRVTIDVANQSGDTEVLYDSNRTPEWKETGFDNNWCAYDNTSRRLTIKPNEIFNLFFSSGLTPDQLDVLKASIRFMGTVGVDVHGIINPDSETIDVNDGILEVKPLYAKGVQLGIPDGVTYHADQPDGIIKLPHASNSVVTNQPLEVIPPGDIIEGLFIRLDEAITLCQSLMSPGYNDSVYLHFYNDLDEIYDALYFQISEDNVAIFIEGDNGNDILNLYDQLGGGFTGDDIETRCLSYDATTHQLTLKRAMLDNTEQYFHDDASFETFIKGLIFYGEIGEDVNGLISPDSDTISVDHGRLEVKIDNNTIYLEDGKLKAKGSAGDVNEVQLGPDGKIIDPANGVVTLPYATNTGLIDPDLNQIMKDDNVKGTYLDLQTIIDMFTQLPRDTSLSNIISIEFENSVGAVHFEKAQNEDIVYAGFTYWDNGGWGEIIIYESDNTPQYNASNFETDHFSYDATNRTLTFKGDVLFDHLNYEFISPESFETFKTSTIFHGTSGRYTAGVIYPESDTISIDHGRLEVIAPIPEVRVQLQQIHLTNTGAANDLRVFDDTTEIYRIGDRVYLTSFPPISLQGIIAEHAVLTGRIDADLTNVLTGGRAAHGQVVLGDTSAGLRYPCYFTIEANGNVTLQNGTNSIINEPVSTIRGALITSCIRS